MIRVWEKREYRGFDAEVRKPGQRFLATNPCPSSREFRNRDYWRRAKKELHRAYVRCAYTSLRLVGSNGGSVDHFLPKSRYPSLAYEWRNYRLARQRLNNHKGDSEQVVDPFRVRSGWFVLSLPSCLIIPGADLDKETSQEVDTTIEVLKLNSDDNLPEERCNWLADWAAGNVSFPHLQNHYPFLAHEITRQKIDKQQVRTYLKVWAKLSAHS